MSRNLCRRPSDPVPARMTSVPTMSSFSVRCSIVRLWPPNVVALSVPITAPSRHSTPMIEVTKNLFLKDAASSHLGVGLVDGGYQLREGEASHEGRSPLDIPLSPLLQTVHHSRGAALSCCGQAIITPVPIPLGDLDQPLLRQVFQGGIDAAIERSIVVGLEIETRASQKGGKVSVDQKEQLLHLNGAMGGTSGRRQRCQSHVLSRKFLLRPHRSSLPHRLAQARRRRKAGVPQPPPADAMKAATSFLSCSRSARRMYI